MVAVAGEQAHTPDTDVVRLETVDISGLGANEPPFLGEQRRELVDRLLAEFDQVCQSRTPRWWSLEGNSGCGKTRIVQELYRRLATERQAGAKYWPLTFLAEAPSAKIAGPSMSMRKRVYPEQMGPGQVGPGQVGPGQVGPEQEAVPSWFWWGISCATRSGTPIQALTDDLTQFAAHQVGLEQRWRQLASPRARRGAGLSSKKGEVFETGAGEILGVAAGLQDLAVPSLRVLKLAAKWGFQGSQDAHAVQASAVVDVAGRRRPHLVDELAPALERLAAAGLPIVITIEDLHLADESLIELVARLLAAQGAPVMVISTAWHGLLDEDSRCAHPLIERVPPDRVSRVLADETWRDLALSERQSIVRTTLPDVSDWNANLLAMSFTNPLALQLACGVGPVRRAQRNLSADDVAGLSQDIGGLFTQLWNELPQDTRKVLMVAALSTPADISDNLGFGDARWDSLLLTEVSETEAWRRASIGDLSAVLGQRSDAYAWIRKVDEWLGRFHDPFQYDVAVSQAKVESDSLERLSLYEAMARGVSANVAKSPGQRMHQARMLVALASEGLVAWDQTTLAGAMTLCDSLLAEPDVKSQSYVILIVESALLSARTESPVAGPLLTLRGAYGSALGECGRVDEASKVFEQLLADQRRVLGPDAPDTLTTRNNLASLLAKSGQATEATTAFEQLLADQRRVLGPEAPETVTTRNNLASLLGRSGRVTEAINAFEQLLADRTRVLGPDDPDTLTTRNNLASLLAKSGRVAQAITAHEQLLADQRRVLGPDDPDTLTTRSNLAKRLANSGRVDEAITAYEQLLTDRIRLLGPDDPDTLATRNSLTYWLGESGRVAEAIMAFKQLLVDRTRVLGPDDPDTLTTRNNLASLLAESGRVAEAITAFKQLLVDRTRVLGPNDPDTLTTRNNLASLLAESGRVGEAITAFKQLLGDQRRVLGPDAPHTLAARNNLAWLLGRSGQVAEAITAYRRLLSDRTRVLGPDDPDTLATRNSLTYWLGESGRVPEAITAYEQLLADQRKVRVSGRPPWHTIPYQSRAKPLPILDFSTETSSRRSMTN